ncbi:MAG: family protein phosphatase [Acidimicrobiaceae bacterium]|nr:family protein phosphatase [Acidimicrobiaceae bacterium]
MNTGHPGDSGDPDPVIAAGGDLAEASRTADRAGPQPDSEAGPDAPVEPAAPVAPVEPPVEPAAPAAPEPDAPAIPAEPATPIAPPAAADRAAPSPPTPADPGNGKLSGHAILAKLAWAMRSEPGDVRPHNEDFAGVFAPTIPDDAWDRGPFFIVADGLGGHAAGEVASRTAVETALAHWTAGTPAAPHQAVRAAIRAANVAVYDAALSNRHHGMATTFTALTLAGNEAIIGHVGDSRCYLVRGPTTTQLTNDHSRVGEMLRAGLITPDQAANHPARSMISRSVGSEPGVSVDIIRQPTQAGDTFLLCSDGLWDVVGRRDITDVVEAIGTPAVPTVIAAADTLIEQALARNTPDNVTLLVVRITTDRPVPAATTRRSFLRRGRGIVR